MINMKSILTYSLAMIGLICFLSVFFESNNPQIVFCMATKIVRIVNTNFPTIVFAKFIIADGLIYKISIRHIKITILKEKFIIYITNIFCGGI